MGDGWIVGERRVGRYWVIVRSVCTIIQVHCDIKKVYDFFFVADYFYLKLVQLEEGN